MITIQDTPINKHSYRTKLPHWQFKRIDLTIPKPLHIITLQVERGGDFLLRKIITRWSEVTESPATDFSPLTVSLKKSSSIYHYFDEITPKVFSSPCDSLDSEISAAPLPVDNDIYSVLFSKTVRYNVKHFNWLIEQDCLMIIEIRKTVISRTYPQYVDILSEGSFLNMGVSV